jgi:hypothetical protein
MEHGVPKPLKIKKEKLVLKPKVDMGKTNRNIKEEEQDKVFGLIDPAMFKGNTDLQIHLNIGIHKKIRMNFDKSNSLQIKKMKKRIANEDYNIRLPDEEIKRGD